VEEQEDNEEEGEEELIKSEFSVEVMHPSNSELVARMHLSKTISCLSSWEGCIPSTHTLCEPNKNSPKGCGNKHYPTPWTPFRKR